MVLAGTQGHALEKRLRKESSDLFVLLCSVDHFQQLYSHGFSSHDPAGKPCSMMLHTSAVACIRPTRASPSIASVPMCSIRAAIKACDALPLDLLRNPCCLACCLHSM